MFGMSAAVTDTGDSYSSLGVVPAAIHCSQLPFPAEVWLSVSDILSLLVLTVCSIIFGWAALKQLIPSINLLLLSDNQTRCNELKAQEKESPSDSHSDSACESCAEEASGEVSISIPLSTDHEPRPLPVPVPSPSLFYQRALQFSLLLALLCLFAKSAGSLAYIVAGFSTVATNVKVMQILRWSFECCYSFVWPVLLYHSQVANALLLMNAANCNDCRSQTAALSTDSSTSAVNSLIAQVHHKWYWIIIQIIYLNSVILYSAQDSLLSAQVYTVIVCLLWTGMCYLATINLQQTSETTLAILNEQWKGKYEELTRQVQQLLITQAEPGDIPPATILTDNSEERYSGSVLGKEEEELATLALHSQTRIFGYQKQVQSVVTIIILRYIGLIIYSLYETFSSYSALESDFTDAIVFLVLELPPLILLLLILRPAESAKFPSTYFNMSRWNSSESDRGYFERTVEWMRLKWGFCLLLSFYLSINILLILQAIHVTCDSGPGQLGMSVLISRATAKCVPFNLLIVLLPLLNDFTTALRATSLGIFLPIDEKLYIHKLAGAWLLVAGLIHTISHYFNYVTLTGLAPDSQQLAIITHGNGLIKIYEAEHVWFLLPYWTGLGILICIPVIYLAYRVKTWPGWFRTFQYTHRLGAFFFCLLLATHGWLQLLAFPVSWLCLLVPVLIWLVSVYYRQVVEFRNFECEMVGEFLDIKLSPRDDCQLAFVRRCQPGQYLLVCCPSISSYEWRPFTVYDSNSDSIKLLVEVKQGWTKSLAEKLEFHALRFKLESTGKVIRKMLFRVRGPYTSPAAAALEIWNGGGSYEPTHSIASSSNIIRTIAAIAAKLKKFPSDSSHNRLECQSSDEPAEGEEKEDKEQLLPLFVQPPKSSEQAIPQQVPDLSLAATAVGDYILLVATGSGITPMLNLWKAWNRSLLQQLQYSAAQCRSQIRLYFPPRRVFLLWTSRSPQPFHAILNDATLRQATPAPASQPKRYYQTGSAVYVTQKSDKASQLYEQIKSLHPDLLKGENPAVNYGRRADLMSHVVKFAKSVVEDHMVRVASEMRSSSKVDIIKTTATIPASGIGLPLAPFCTAAKPVINVYFCGDSTVKRIVKSTVELFRKHDREVAISLAYEKF